MGEARPSKIDLTWADYDFCLKRQASLKLGSVFASQLRVPGFNSELQLLFVCNFHFSCLSSGCGVSSGYSGFHPPPKYISVGELATLKLP